VIAIIIKRKEVILMADQLKQFTELAKTAASIQLDTLLDRRGEITKLDFTALEKLGILLRNSAANNGVCGLGCASRPFEGTTIKR
jgi:hypothetical protein